MLPSRTERKIHILFARNVLASTNLVLSFRKEITGRNRKTSASESFPGNFPLVEVFRPETSTRKISAGTPDRSTLHRKFADLDGPGLGVNTWSLYNGFRALVVRSQLGEACVR